MYNLAWKLKKNFSNGVIKIQLKFASVFFFVSKNEK